MLKSTYLLLIVSFLLSSCKTVSVLNETQKSTSTRTSLGVLVDNNNSILDNDFKAIALPQYANPIKVSVVPIAFNKKSHKIFQEAKRMQNSTVAVNYVDSMATKPIFLKLEIIDVLELVESVNRPENKALKSYLELKTKASIITGISMVVNPQIQEDLLQANEVFLQPNGMKSYALKAYKDGVLKHTLMFDQSVVFAYKTSSFCWQEDAKHQLQVIDITEGKCSKGSYKNSKYARKEIDYLKF